MDVQIAVFLSMYGYNLDALPYKFHSIHAQKPEKGHFVTVSPQDALEIQNWPQCPQSWFPGCSAFYPVWQTYLQSYPVSWLKFYAARDLAPSILGLLHLDHNKPCDEGNRVLETAPSEQAGASGQQFRGIGKALIARLVLQCYVSQRKRLIIRVHPRNKVYYSQLGFVPLPFGNGRMTMEWKKAEQLLKDYFF